MRFCILVVVTSETCRLKKRAYLKLESIYNRYRRCYLFGTASKKSLLIFRGGRIPSTRGINRIA